MRCDIDKQELEWGADHLLLYNYIRGGRHLKTDLERWLKQAVEQEKYNLAALYRDEIKRIDETRTIKSKS